MELLVGIGLGIVIGRIMELVLIRTNKPGSLVICYSDLNDDPNMHLELLRGLNYICRKKYVMFRVRVERPHQ